LLRRKPRSSAPDQGVDTVPIIEPADLTGVIRVPNWLRDAGLMSWLLVGIGLLVSSLIALAALTQVIVVPVIVAAIVAAVCSPVISWLAKRGLPRALGSVLMMLAIIAVAVGMVAMVVIGITGETTSITDNLDDATGTLAGWAEDAGLSSSEAEDAKNDASSAISESADKLLNGVLQGIAGLSSLAFFLAMTALSLFFLLKDGPQIRSWAEGHLGVPRALATTITHRTLQSLRGYFLGVTIVAAFNAAVVSIGCLILGVPLIGTIAAVTFVGAYIPYLGAWTAAGFSVLLALGGAGPEAAAGMIVVQLLANGILQQMVQPFAMGTALGIHPLAVLIVTIAGGALFGTIGLILAAPVVSAVTRISADLARVRASEDEAAGTEPPTDAQPAPAQ
jgi:predicted PurR-regulated permease PerM